ncbi:MAG TPA: hypothetical protein VKO18_09705 [Terriglobia bacterium]|nr:hypothetical protein [Terriglobia bacterium]
MPRGDEDGIPWFTQIVVLAYRFPNMRVVLRPFRENRRRAVGDFELTPNLTYLQPAEDHMGILSLGVKPETIGWLSEAVKPAEKQENVSFSDTPVEEVSAGRIGLTEHRQPARLSNKVTTDKIRVQMARIGPSYPGFTLATVEAELFHH